MTDLGTLGGTFSIAIDVNNRGQATGEASIAGDSQYHAFLYSGGIMTDLGGLGGTFAFGTNINSSGQVVGAASLPGDTEDHGFLYSAGAMTDLNTLIPANSGLTIVSAGGINAQGQISATGVDASGNYHALLLTPVSSNSVGQTLGAAILPGPANGVGAADASPAVSQRASAVDLGRLASRLVNTGQSTVLANPLLGLSAPPAPRASPALELPTAGTTAAVSAGAADTVFAAPYEATNDDGGWLFAPLFSNSLGPM